MGTISDKLSYLNTTKSKLKDVINYTGAGIDSTTTFRAYEERLYNGLLSVINNPDLLYSSMPHIASVIEEGSINDTANVPIKLSLRGNAKQATSILPDGYTQVDYIESNGNQHINTLFIPSANSRFEVKMAFNNLNSTQKMGLGFNSTDYERVNFGYDKDNNKFVFGYGNNSNLIFGNFTPDTSQHTFVVDGKNKLVKIDDLSETITLNYSNTNGKIYLFKLYSNPNVVLGCSCKFYNSKIYENDTIVRDFIPCYRNSDNVVGLYDIVNDVFYTNQGTGVFTYGSVVQIPNPNYPQDIHVVSGDNEVVISNKNLLYYDSKSTSWNNANIKTENNLVIYTPNSDGAGSLSHNSYTQYINMQKGKTITFSQEYLSGDVWTSGALTNALRLLREDGTYTQVNFGDINAGNYNIKKEITYTLNEDYVGFYCYVMMYAVTGATTHLTYQVQLEYNSTSTEYAPHQEQIYPLNLGSLELCKIGDYEDEIRESTGKNLFNGAMQLGTTDYSTGTLIEGNTRITSTQWTTLQAGTYTINAKSNINNTLNVSNVTFTLDDAFYNIPNVSGQWKELPFTFTTPIAIKWKLNLRYSDNSNIELSQVFDVQLEKGSSTTDPEPFGAGKWYKYGMIGKVILDGTQNITLQSINSYNIANFLITFAHDYTDTTKYVNMLVNAFSKQTSTIGTTKTEGFLPTLNSVNGILGVYLRIGSATASTTTAMNAWLSSHNTTVYYVLSTPTITEITDTTLISQLNAIKSAMAYDEQTNISQINNDLPFRIGYTAIKRFGA